MDPFEARLLFNSKLDHLSGAQASIDSVVSFALKNAGMADDLFECINEKLDKQQVPLRLNMLLALDGILLGSGRTSTAEAAQTWCGLLKKDIVRIVEQVVPETQGGDGNVAQVRKVVSGWRRRTVFDRAVLDRLGKLMQSRGGGGGSNGAAGGDSASEEGMKHEYILKRIEEDRERHKRHKEDVWIRPANEPPASELGAYWETTSDFNEADWQEISVENAEYQQERRLQQATGSTI
ncbi:hypothetical protein GGF46_003496 [Coemansia sp. RSA 552]|nr:hypothetical protein GGF46_003496 [Coemansia sp. RSA 552]